MIFCGSPEISLVASHPLQVPFFWGEVDWLVLGGLIPYSSHIFFGGGLTSFGVSHPLQFPYFFWRWISWFWVVSSLKVPIFFRGRWNSKFLGVLSLTPLFY